MCAERQGLTITQNVEPHISWRSFTNRYRHRHLTLIEHEHEKKKQKLWAFYYSESRVSHRRFDIVSSDDLIQFKIIFFFSRCLLHHTAYDMLQRPQQTFCKVHQLRAKPHYSLFWPRTHRMTVAKIVNVSSVLGNCRPPTTARPIILQQCKSFCFLSLVLRGSSGGRFATNAPQKREKFC